MKRCFREVWNQGKLDTIHELLSPDAVATGQGGRIRSAFPDITTTVEDAFGLEDKVVVRWSATMTHRGDALGIPATGKHVRITGMTIVRIANGQIVEGWDNWDQLSHARADRGLRATGDDHAC
jgi:predicted ester cyclase